MALSFGEGSRGQQRSLISRWLSSHRLISFCVLPSALWVDIIGQASTLLSSRAVWVWTSSQLQISPCLLVNCSSWSCCPKGLMDVCFSRKVQPKADFLPV